MRGASRWVAGVWLAAFAALVGNTAVSSYNINVLIHNDDLVTHTRQVKEAVSDLLADLRDAETGHRGYQITGQPDFLEPYTKGIGRVGLRQQRLRELLADDPEQFAKLDALDAGVAGKLAEMAEGIRVRDTRGADAGRDFVATGRGKRLMDSVREQAAFLERRENERLVERSRVAKAKYLATTVTSLIGGGLTLAMVGLAYSLLRGELNRRRRAEADARLTAAALAASQKATAAALAQLNAFLDNAPVGIAFYDPDLRYRQINTTLAAANGASPAAHLGRRTEDILPDFPAGLRADYRAVQATGVTVTRTVPFPSPDVVWDVTLFPVPDPAGGPRGLGVFAQNVTERVAAEDRLRASEANFRTLADAVPAFVFVTRPDGYTEYFNSQWYAYTGLAPAECLGDRWVTPLHPADRDRSAAVWNQAVATGAAYEIEYRIRGRDGAYRWFVGRATPSRDRVTGAIVRWFGTCTDIDDAKRLEAELTASRGQYRTLAESVPGFVWRADPAGRLDYMNNRVAEYAGRPLADLLGDGWPDIVHPADRDRTGAAWGHALATGEPYQVEFRVRRHDGAYRWFLAQAVAVRDAAGRVERWHGTTSDIDDFKALAVTAQTNAERFRLLTESIPQMVWNADAAGRATYANSRWREYTGLPPAPAPVGDWLAAVVHPADWAAVAADWAKTVAGGAALVFWEVRVKRAADGVYRWFVVAVTPLARPDGTVDQWIGSLSDIDDQKREAGRLELMVRDKTAALVATNDTLRAEVAERKRAEQRERAAAVELRRSNGELEKFAYVASHDLQEPLRKIQAFGDRLSQKYRPVLGDQGIDYLDRMQSSATRMRTLINDLLTFSRVATRTDPFAPVDLGEAVRDALGNLEVRLSESGGKVVVGDLPTVPADATQMRQLFQNLIGNALKFQKPGVPPVVTVSATGPAGTGGVRVTVADNGIGFEPQYAERIFDVFQRLHGRGEYEGTGIGLAICRKIVERHGGTVTARGVPGDGAAFDIVLPTSGAFGPRTGDP